MFSRKIHFMVTIFEVLKVFLGGGPSKNHIWSVIAPILKLGWNF